MRIGGISYFIYSTNGSIDCSIEPYSKIGTINIIINCTGYPDNRKIELSTKKICTSKRAIPSYNYKPIYTGLPHILHSNLPIHRIFKFRTTGRKSTRLNSSHQIISYAV